MTRWHGFRLLAVACLAPGCGGGGGGGGGGGTEPPGPPAQLAKTGGDNQTWYFNNALPSAYAVTLRDASGRAVPGVAVTWAVAAGDGSVSPTQGTTNASGVTTATHTLGPSATTQTATATVAGIPAATFTATAEAAPASGAVDLINITFRPADTAVVVGGTVTWTWRDNPEQHNVTFEAGPTPRPANSTTKPTGIYEVTFTTAGVYDYTCTIHAGMDGKMRVVNP
ncbi:MAG: plastocyanin/azurin family copper-binding protein [Gemmatimonadales bacterium]